jgi:transposase
VSSEEIAELLGREETRYVKRLLRAWNEEPEEFAEYVRELEEILDLRKKLSERGARRGST